MDGEGLSGILTEQAGTWFYKRNHSPLNQVVNKDNLQTLEAHYTPLEVVAKTESGAGGWSAISGFAGGRWPTRNMRPELCPDFMSGRSMSLGIL